MTSQSSLRRATPVIRTISIADVLQSLKEGWADFLRAPKFGLFFAAFYVLGGFAIWYFLFRLNSPWLIIPIGIGFPLIGPYAAVGLYETSRRITTGEPLDWNAIVGVVLRQRQRELSWMAFVVLFVLWIWMYQVRLLTAVFLGMRSMSSIEAFTKVVTTTSDGMLYLGIGTAVGAVLSLVLFSVTVVAIPLLLEREYDFVTAIVTSVKSVIANPGPMVFFGAAAAVATFIGLMPAFLGLFVVFPVFGHATWRLYKRVIA